MLSLLCPEAAVIGSPHKRTMTGGCCAVAVPDKLDMKIQFKHSNDPKTGGGKGGTKPKTSIILWDTAQIKDGFAYSQALGTMRENVGSPLFTKTQDRL